MKAKVTKVVIPVAGLGTRGLPFTKEVPKEMLPIIDTPTIHYIVEEVIAAGVEQLVFVTSKGKSMLEDYFDPSPNLVHWLKKRGKDELAEKIDAIGHLCEVITVRQKEPLGLGHAIYCARHIIADELFAVCLGDEIFPAGQSPSVLERLARTAEKTKESVVGVVSIPPEETLSYGMIDIGGETLEHQARKVLRTVEKPKPEVSPSPYAIIGRYVFEPMLFDMLKDVKPGVGGELQLTDGMDRLAVSGRLNALRIDSPRYDIGNHLSYLRAQIDEALKRPHLAVGLRRYLNSLEK